jgi:hypothetical protein
MQTKLALLGIITVLSWFWLWFVVRRPERWNALVDKENAFWVSRRWVSASLSERIKRLEKGRCLKILLGFVAVLGTLIVPYGLWTLTRR